MRIGLEIVINLAVFGIAWLGGMAFAGRPTPGPTAEQIEGHIQGMARVAGAAEGPASIGYGIINYEAYRVGAGGTTHTGDPMPEWPELGDRQRAGWTVGGRACALAAVDDYRAQLDRAGDAP